MASRDDLRRAASQGTILAVRVGRKIYGRGKYNSPWGYSLQNAGLAAFTGLLLLSVLCCFSGKKPIIFVLIEKLKRYRRRIVHPNGLKEVLSEISDDVTVQTEQFWDETNRRREDIRQILEELQRDRDKEHLTALLKEKEADLERKQSVIDDLRRELDMEQMMHGLERIRLEEQNEALREQLRASIGPTLSTSVDGHSSESSLGTLTETSTS